MSFVSRFSSRPSVSRNSRSRPTEDSTHSSTLLTNRTPLCCSLRGDDGACGDVMTDAVSERGLRRSEMREPGDASTSAAVAVIGLRGVS